MFELVIIWFNGEKDIYGYETEADAEKAGRNMKMVFGNQIEWYGTRRKR